MIRFLSGIIVGIMGCLIVLHSHKPIGIEETHTATDTTRVTEHYVEEIRQIERDTVTVYIEVPVPVTIDSLNHYTSHYSDEMITAKWSSIVNVRLESQEFEYYMRSRLVREDKLTINQRLVTTRTIQPHSTGKLSATIQLTHLKHLSYGASYNTGSVTFTYLYTPQLKGHTIGVSVPIKQILPF